MESSLQAGSISPGGDWYYLERSTAGLKIRAYSLDLNQGCNALLQDGSRGIRAWTSYPQYSPWPEMCTRNNCTE